MPADHKHLANDLDLTADDVYEHDSVPAESPRLRIFQSGTDLVNGSGQKPDRGNSSYSEDNASEL